MKRFITPIVMLFLSAANVVAVWLYVCSVLTEQNVDIASISFAFCAPVLAVAYIIYRAATIRNENIAKNAKYENRFLPGMIVFFMVLAWLLAIVTIRKDMQGFNLEDYLPGGAMVVIGAIIMLLGNVFGKLKQNFFFGFRNAATLISANVWKKTHRLNGVTAMIGGFVLMIAGVLCVLNPQKQDAFLIAGVCTMIVLVVLIPYICSYVFLAEEKRSESAEGADSKDSCESDE